MHIPTYAEELIEAVARAGGTIEPHLLSKGQIGALARLPRLKQFDCEACGLTVIGDHQRRYCAACSHERQNHFAASRERARRRNRKR